MPRINFFSEDVAFRLKNKRQIIKWIHQTAAQEGKAIEEVSYIFCSDEYLRQINVDYLNHDYLTDIITFDNSDQSDKIEGDIFISVDRVKENALNFDSTWQKELFRVIIHGILHLIGYKDKTREEELLMREKEDYYLNQLAI